MSTHDHRDLNLQPNPAELKPLFHIKPGVHAAGIAFNWAIILFTIYLCVTFFNPVLYLLAVIVIGARMHALAILMHDAAHFRFLKNRTWNDRLTNITTMYLLFSSIEKYRQNHLRHHQHLNTEEDPDWFAKLGKQAFRFPKTRLEFAMTVLSYLTLFRGIQDAFWFLKRFGRSEKKTVARKSGAGERLGFYAVLIVLLTAGHLWGYFLLYWVIPYFSTFFMFQYIRSVAEHYGELSYDHVLTETRSVKANALERFLLAPHNVGYHLEHHLYPGVPFYHLPRLHELLMKDDQYRSKAHITQGYLSGLMNELG